VHGTDFTLAINGLTIVAFTIPEYANGNLVGIDVWRQDIQVRSFTVTRLAPAAPLPALPPVKAVSLTPGEAPTGFQFRLGYYYTPVEAAQFFGGSSGITNPGLRIFYHDQYGPQQSPATLDLDVSTNVFAYDSTANAEIGAQANWVDNQAEFAHAGNRTTADLVGVGVDGHVAAGDLSFRDAFGAIITEPVVEVCFREGIYMVDLFVPFVMGSLSQSAMIAQAMALAKRVDAHAQAAG
jgi:hypothetical protein